MKPPIRRSRCSRRKLRRQAGITMVLVALAMVAIIAMAALSIDVVTLYLARMEAQRSADAAALAAARVIALSGLTGDPANSSGSWAAICGGASSPATQAAIAAAKQNAIGAIAPTVTVTYSVVGSSPAADCSGLTAAFGVNPIVTAQVTRSGLPTFFSRIWGNAGNTVTATATAEVFNSSNSGTISNGPPGTITPVQPRCVKPWMVPNRDPLSPNPNGNGTFCDVQDPVTHVRTPCQPFVNLSNGQIARPGISLNGGYNAVIGETFWLSPDCVHNSSPCQFRPVGNGVPPQGNFLYPGGPGGSDIYLELPPSMQYLAGAAPSTLPVAVPSCSSGASLYQQAIAGCDQSTVYQCGVQNMNTIDLSENPGMATNDTMNGVLCLVHQSDATDITDASGQDTLSPFAAPSAYPFQILAGTSNPLVGNGLAAGAPITSSSSIVTVPVYDDTKTIKSSGTTQVTIVGFLQVFINAADQYGNVNVTVLNVTGCSNGGGQTVGTPVQGSSPVPVRLITPP
jgi:Tfp pilus assembly protein FimT